MIMITELNEKMTLNFYTLVTCFQMGFQLYVTWHRIIQIKFEVINSNRAFLETRTFLICACKYICKQTRSIPFIQLQLPSKYLAISMLHGLFINKSGSGNRISQSCLLEHLLSTPFRISVSRYIFLKANLRHQTQNTN